MEERITRRLWWRIMLTIALLARTSQARDAEETQVDTHEGSTVLLQCRFHPPREKATCFWLTHTNNAHDNAAIQDAALAPHYKVHMMLSEGRYDLEIKNVSYGRDNGKYECRVKVAGTGDNLYHKNVTLTVLRVPSTPVIVPSTSQAREGERLELNCNTMGGSPEPEVKWFRSDVRNVIHTGRTYVMVPGKEDDKATLRCQVRNRAMSAGDFLQAAYTLDVQYYPRVSIGTENPMRVDLNSTAQLRCNVDAKPAVNQVKWLKDNSFVATTFNHVITRVTMQDAGRYTCQADNGLSRKGESFLELDVQYPPSVSIEGDRLRIVEQEDTVIVHCNVTANPKPLEIYWLRDGHPEFHYKGNILRLSRISASEAGNYTCRAINTVHASGTIPKNHSATSRVEIRVRHKPGPARISPDAPVAIESDSSAKVILTCIANPPGYPEPSFRWSRLEEGGYLKEFKPEDHTGARLEINNVKLHSEGQYKCHAFNEIGDGEAASVNLTVHQPPKFLSKLQPQVTKKVGDSSFQVTCVGQGKPRPEVSWLKDDRPITADENHYNVETSYTEVHAHASIVNSTLRFIGNARPQTDSMIASDRGKYTCAFDNKVKTVQSDMMLKVEHPPIIQNTFGKVAADAGETVNVTCKVQAWPKAEFQWSFGNHAAPLQGSSSDGHYEISTFMDKYDIYTSILNVKNIRDTDYGDYSCRAANSLGSVVTSIRLQEKGAPERPTKLHAVDIGPSHVALGWTLGFDGGLPVTKYFISYRRVSGAEQVLAPDCTTPTRSPTGQWQEVQCFMYNPCNVTNLEQHQTYAFKVKVYNTANHSDYSDEVTATTAVARIPAPARAAFDPESNQLSIYASPSCLALVAVIEKYDSSLESWREMDEWPMAVLGGSNTLKTDTLVDNAYSYSMDGEQRVRVRFCLKADRSKCGDYFEAEIGPTHVAQAGPIATPTLIALIVSGAVFCLFGALLLLFCRCRRKNAAKAKDYEMDSNTVRPSLVAGNGQQTQPPPPYYAENKALEHSLDHALALEDSKTPAYGQTTYGYHSTNHNLNGVNMGYMENSYSNSNNGGSVNSQDSIWQMKSAAANGVNAQYDMGGYVAAETDYPTHAHYMPQRDDYRDAHNISRQQFCEPFATVPKSQRNDLQYDVSGLPYQESYDEDAKPPQQVSISYDESMESGYSTPNSRARRIIREIIV